MFCYLFIYLFVYLLHSQTKNPEGNTLGLFYIILWNWTDSQGGFFLVISECKSMYWCFFNHLFDWVECS